MAGHIEKRGPHTWRINVYLGTDPITGKELRHKETFKGLKAEAEARMTEVLSEHNKGEYVKPTKQTLNEFLDRWLTHKKSRLKPLTFHKDKSNIEDSRED